ncbi:MAG: nucleotidyl transferase AbiEii/AbiGii toxin family protein [Anaerovoracaceae bacterium]
MSALSRARFFKHTAFCDGTALRIFYGLDRFSEDLDFSLKALDASEAWTPRRRSIIP